MSEKLFVSLPSSTDSGYSVYIEKGSFDSIGNAIKEFCQDYYSTILAVIDPNIQNHPSLISSEFNKIILPNSGEKLKTFSSIEWLLTEFSKFKLDRKSIIIAVGGGAVGDSVSFAASIYMRGLRVVQVPTTLLSMVDSSVGGKTGINFNGVKNLIGTFWYPSAVMIDTNFLSTLPNNQLISGFAEVIKHGIIADEALFRRCTKKPVFDLSQDELNNIIKDSVNIKRQVVEKDPLEKAERKTLNFGHTVGHAIESLSYTELKEPLLHGEAIAIGMLYEAKLAEKIFDTAKELSQQIKLANTFNQLPTILPNIDPLKILSVIKADKKNENDRILMALPERLGSCKFNIEVSEGEILSILSN